MPPTVPPKSGEPQPTILIAYDSSPDAEAAVELAATAFGGARATVLTVWEPSIVAALRLARGGRPPLHAVGPDRVGKRPEQVAYGIAARGAERARSLGLAAEPRSAAGHAEVWRAIVDAATDERADVIIIGHHGLTGRRSALAGSVAQSVVRHADLPVLVVPPVEPAEVRAAAVAGRGGAPAGGLPKGGLRLQVVPLDEV